MNSTRALQKEAEKSTKTLLFVSAVLIATVFLIYSNSFSNSFLYDDDHLIIHNQFLRSWQNLPVMFLKSLAAGSNASSTYYRPLQSLLYLFVFQFTGLSTSAFHFLNVSLHAINACLMFRLGCKLRFHTFAVFIATLLWAVHPIHTEAVTYMSATADTLCALFCLSGAIVMLPDFSRQRIWFGSLLFVLALLSKEGAIGFPLLAAGLLYCSNERRFDYKIYFRLWPLALISIAYVLLHFVLLAHQAAPPVRSPATPPSFLSGLMPFGTVPQYFRLLIWPSSLHMKHVLDPTSCWERINIIIGICLFLASIFLVLRQQTVISMPLSWGLLWFDGAFFPVSSIGDILYEHWMYLPSIGLFLGIAQTIAVTVKDRLKGMAIILPLSICCVFGFLTFEQNTIWRDPVSFYTNIIQHEPIAPDAHTNLGLYYALEGDYEAALTQYDVADHDFTRSTDTTTIDNRSALQNTVAMTLLEIPDGKDRHEEAIQHLQRALEFDPNNYLALRNLAKIYLERGDEEKSRYYLQKAESLDQQHPGLSAPQ